MSITVTIEDETKWSCISFMLWPPMGKIQNQLVYRVEKYMHLLLRALNSMK